MFSTRIAGELAPNRLTSTLRTLRAENRPVIDLTESNPTRAGFRYPADLLAPLGDTRALRYDPQPLGAIDARRAVAADYARQGIEVSPDRIALTASTSDAYSLLFKLLANADDEVLVPRPSYPLFDHLTRLDLVTPASYALEYHGVWSVDIASVERAISDRTRAMLVVSPNNPTGSFLSAGELEQLARLCASRQIAIISDEVFADYELEPGARAAAGRPLSREDVLSFTLGGLSKSIGLPQVKLAWIAVGGPPHLAAAAIERLELMCDTYLTVATPVQVAASNMLSRGAAVRAQIANRVVANYRQLHAAVAAVPSCRVLHAGGGWYAVLHVPSLATEEELVVTLLTAEGVLAHPGYFFDFPRESFLIVSLLPEPSVFADGTARLLRHFDCSAAIS
jgi:aspartate/methionine/tyrosine aminotransferase